jgi:hypothetical protein
MNWKYNCCLVVAMMIIIVSMGHTVLAEEAPSARFEKVLNKMVAAINAEDFKAIEQDFSQTMVDAFPIEKSKPFFKNLIRDAGKIKKVDTPRFVPPNQAIFPAHFERTVLDIKIVLDGQDKIIGLWFLPHTPEIPVPEKHAARLDLPFEDRWMVFWGGDTKEENQHHDVPNQKYAFDLLKVDQNGKTHQHEGNKNADYFAFGKKVLAPAGGVVTDVIRGVRDNIPGSMNPYSALGNAVFIQHRDHEISVLAHLKLGSITVNVGDRVESGQLIGLCGNSGNSSEPHLHYHLQNTPVIQDGTGIKVFFKRVIVEKNGIEQSITKYSPVKGDMLKR